MNKEENTNRIKNRMIILFILTIISLWGGLYSFALLCEINPLYGTMFIKNAWIFWCWLPIPILSIILGFKFNKKGFKCTKNIVAGFIIGISLFIYGSLTFIPTFYEDYNRINDYKEYIDAKLPSNGELEILNFKSHFEDDKTDHIIIRAYYGKEDVNDLVNSIEKSNNWILSNDIKSELKIFIPYDFKSDYDAYYSIYNKTTNQYNTLPESEGKYEIYAMKYDKSDKLLEIHKFKYSYK